MRKLELSQWWEIKGLAGRTSPPGDEYKLLLLELLPSLHHHPPASLSFPPLTGASPSTDTHRIGIVLLVK